MILIISLITKSLHLKKLYNFSRLLTYITLHKILTNLVGVFLAHFSNNLGFLSPIQSACVLNQSCGH
jgi:hypothetical protein